MIRVQFNRHRSSSYFYALCAGVCVVFAAPHLLHSSLPAAWWFTGIWSGFALFCIAANLWFVLGVDNERAHAQVRSTSASRPINRLPDDAYIRRTSV